MSKKVDKTEQDSPSELDLHFKEKEGEKHENRSPLSFLDGNASAMGVRDEDELKAQSEIVRHLFNFPLDRLLAWSRWQPREIPLIANILTRSVATSPNRPKNPDGTLKRLSIIKIESLAWLRLAEKGKMRDEAMGGLRQESEEKTQADGWVEK